MEPIIIIIIFTFVLFVLYLLELKNKKDFESQGIPYLGNGIYRFFTNNWKGIGFIQDFEVQYLRCRKSLKNPRFAGGYDLGQKSLLLIDPLLIKSVLVKDFDHFVDRRVSQMPQGDYLWVRMLVSLQGGKWKAMRSAVTPALTTGKIKAQFPLFENSGKKLVKFFQEEIDHLEQKNTRDDGIDLTNGFSKFTMDIISSTVVGLDSKAFDQRDPSLFETMGKKMEVRFRWFQFLSLAGKFLPTKISALLGLSLFGEKVQAFFTQLVKSSIAQRREGGGGEKRNDFIEMMLAARDGKLKSEDEEQSTCLKKAELACLLDELGITANCALFISDGFNTIQSLLLFTTYALALDQGVQDRLRLEVDAVFEKNDDELPYDAVQGMVYLDMVVNEAMRLYPPAGMIDRCCTKDYQIPGTNIIMEAGSGVSIAINGLHHDPEYYPEPFVFNPERFSPQNRSKIVPYTFMPFGEGPRMCIGMRFALADVKVCMAQMVHNFKIEPSRRTLIPMKYKDNVVLTPDGGMFLSLKKLR